MKRIVLLIAILVVCSLALISCDNGKPAATTTTTAPVTTAPVIEAQDLDISGYKVIRGDSAPLTTRRFATRIVEKIKEFAGVEIEIATDFSKTDADIDNEAYEILVGETNRQASIDALAELNTKESSNYLIKVTDKKIVIVGKDTEGLVMGVKEFENRVLKKSEGNGKIPVKNGYKFMGKGEYDYLFDNGVTLTLGRATTVFGLKKENEASYYTYPTIIQLRHSGENNGTLVASCEGSEFTVKISTDDGKNWTKVSNLYNELAKCGNNFYPHWMPFLFELPVEMGEYPEGTIIMACTTANKRGNDFSRSAISFYASTDLCKTWEAVSDAAFGGGGPGYNPDPDKGVWEPFLEYDNESGRLYCFYTDDSDPNYDQKLVYKWTEDLVNWSELTECVRAKDPVERPGMPVLAKMDNGKYALIYERVKTTVPNESSGTCYIKVGELDNWGDPEDMGVVVKTKDGEDCKSTPYVSYTPIGGDCGTLFALGRSKCSDGRLCSDLFLSFDYGKTYVSIDNPLEFDPARCGWSASMFFTEDGQTLYYAINQRADNNTGNTGNTYINLIKITIAE